MKFKLLGKSGLRVSEMALGGMTTGNAWGWGADKDISLKVLKEYSDAGGNYIDTSCNYQDGESEKIIGEFVKGDRDRYVIATKFTLYNFAQLKMEHKDDPNRGGNARKNMRRSVKESLERLDTDYIDILYCHMWDYMTPVRELMQGLNDLVRSGLVNYIGISDTPAWVVSRANAMADHFGWERFVTYQFPYSLDYRDAEREVIPLCKYDDMAMATFQALQEGLFTGKYTRGESGKGRLKPDEWKSDRGKKMLEIAREVDTIADEIGVPSSHVAISWVHGLEGTFTPILGATKADQMKENIEAVELRLKPEHYERLDKMVKEKLGFNWGFPKGWLMGARPYIYGDTYDKIINHRDYQ
ncbi:MAG: aldo/keto reductase [Candidatus Kariarchaeaceae archaeon]|jgi:aryl-alcohol dehydrogenase-like predicted oxidoreductase